MEVLSQVFGIHLIVLGINVVVNEVVLMDGVYAIFCILQAWFFGDSLVLVPSIVYNL